MQGQYAATQRESESTFDEGDLRRTKQRLTDEMRRLQPYYRRADDDAVAAAKPHGDADNFTLRKLSR